MKKKKKTSEKERKKKACHRCPKQARKWRHTVTNVPPSFFAISNLSGLTSTPIIFEAPAILAPWITASPFTVSQDIGFGTILVQFLWKHHTNTHFKSHRLSRRKTTRKSGPTYDGTQSKHGHTTVHFDFTSVPNCSQSCGNTAPKEAHLFQGRFRVDLGTRNFR